MYIKKIYISHLSEHLAEELEEEFYLKEIAMNYTEENGIPYLFLKLQDKTGIVYGRIWENNIDEQYLYFKGKVIRAWGEVLKNHKNQLEFTIQKIIPVTEYEISSFIDGLNETEREQYLSLLDKQNNLVTHAPFRELLDLVLKGQRTKLSETPVSLSCSGAYNGALLVQTVSVTSIAIQIMRSQKMYAYHPDLKIPYQEDLLITGSLLFGIGITNLYTPFPEAKKISEYSLLPKDILSIQIIESYIKEMKNHISTEDKNLLYNMIQNTYKKERLRAMNREALILNLAYTSYLQISNMEFYMTEHQQKSGAVYIPKINNYLYLSKPDIQGGIGNAPTNIHK